MTDVDRLKKIQHDCEQMAYFRHEPLADNLAALASILRERIEEEEAEKGKELNRAKLSAGQASIRTDSNLG